uniref:Uncharacterized protein n=1 Tax=Anguilla anguilla TaxID=7936 RepID=A0A0E9PWC6_ANGAN
MCSNSLIMYIGILHNSPNSALPKQQSRNECTVITGCQHIKSILVRILCARAV